MFWDILSRGQNPKSDSVLIIFGRCSTLLMHINLSQDIKKTNQILGIYEKKKTFNNQGSTRKCSLVTKVPTSLWNRADFSFIQHNMAAGLPGFCRVNDLPTLLRDVAAGTSRSTLSRTWNWCCSSRDFVPGSQRLQLSVGSHIPKCGQQVTAPLIDTKHTDCCGWHRQLSWTPCKVGCNSLSSTLFLYVGDRCI